MNISDAYDECERITRSKARDFAYGIRLLPLEKRRAISAVYALACRIDDIASLDDRVRRLDDVRIQLFTLDSADPVLLALAHATERYNLPLDAFNELIDGRLDDVAGTVYGTFGDLLNYCRGIAGSMSRLCLALLGSNERERDEPLAEALGVAFRLTGIMRDVLADRRNGRIYLPADELAQFGCSLDLGSGGFTDDKDKLVALLLHQGARAEEWYDKGLPLLSTLDARSRTACAAVTGIHQELLHQLTARPTAMLHKRVTLPNWQKIAIAARSLVRP